MSRLKSVYISINLVIIRETAKKYFFLLPGHLKKEVFSAALSNSRIITPGGVFFMYRIKFFSRASAPALIDK